MAYPIFPTSNDGTINDFQSLACASATLVAGPPIAALEAINNRCGKNADANFVVFFSKFLPQNLYPSHNIIPWILYRLVKNIVNGSNAARTLSATAIPGAPAVAKNRYRQDVPRISDVFCIDEVKNRFGDHDANNTVSSVQHGNEPILNILVPRISPNHSNILDKNNTVDTLCIETEEGWFASVATLVVTVAVDDDDDGSVSISDLSDANALVIGK